MKQEEAKKLIDAADRAAYLLYRISNGDHKALENASEVAKATILALRAADPKWEPEWLSEDEWEALK